MSENSDWEKSRKYFEEIEKARSIHETRAERFLDYSISWSKELIRALVILHGGAIIFIPTLLSINSIDFPLTPLLWAGFWYAIGIILALCAVLMGYLNFQALLEDEYNVLEAKYEKIFQRYFSESIDNERAELTRKISDKGKTIGYMKRGTVFVGLLFVVSSGLLFANTSKDLVVQLDKHIKDDRAPENPS